MTITTKKAINSNDIMWSIDISTAKKVRNELKKESHTRGSWVYINVIQPINTAIRHKKAVANIYSSGFSNCEVAKILNRTVGYDY